MKKNYLKTGLLGFCLILIQLTIAQSDVPIVKGDYHAKKSEETLLVWSGTLSDTDYWAIYEGGCGDKLLGTTKLNSFEFSPSETGVTLFVRAENDQGNLAGNCGSFTYDFKSSETFSFDYSKDEIKSLDDGKQLNLSGNINGTFWSPDGALVLDPDTGFIDPTQSENGDYTVYFFPNNSYGYVTSTLSVNNVAILSISGTTQAAEDTTDGLFTITADNTVANDTNISFTISGTAAEGVDYSSIGNSVLMPANSSTVTIPIDVIADSSLEGNENVQITLTGTDDTDVTVGASNTATIDIIDNDNALVILTDTSGNEDAGPITVTATLSNPVQGGFTVDVSTANGSATAGTDYNAINGQTLVFSGTNNETQTFQISPIADTDLEGDETVIVSLSNLQATSLPVNITDSAIVTLLNDEVDCGSAAAVDFNIQTYDSSCLNGTSGAASAILYYEGFETAQPSPSNYGDSIDPIPGLPGWRYEGAPNAGARLNIFSSGNANRANNGSFALGLDDGNFIPHSIIWTVDLSAQAGDDDISFSYFFYNSNDEFTIDDQVSVRGDSSQSWVTLSVWNDGFTNTWQERVVDLDATLSAAGQSMTAATEIRFTHSDNFAFPTDGVIFDDIKIFKEGYTYQWSNNETTGVVQDLAPGNYTVTITSPDGCVVNQNVTINGTPLDDASFSYSNTNYCPNDAPETPTITGLSGGFFNSSPFGLDINPNTGEINFANSIQGRTYNVTYNTNGPCPNSSTEIVVIDFLDNADFGYPSNSLSTSDPAQFPFFINTPGGTFSSTPSGLSIDATTGLINPSLSTIGSYTVTYNTNGTCPNSSSQTFVISDVDNVPPVARCQDFSGNLDANGLLVINDFDIDAGSSDDVGVQSIQASQTVFNCDNLGPNTVTLIVTDTSGNQDTCTATVTVSDIDAPVIQCANVTLELDANGQASLDTLYNTGDSYDVQPTTFGEDVLSNPTVLNLGDDQVARNLPLGFDFTFFGNSYNTFQVSSNGFIAFSNVGSGCCSGGDLTAGFVNPNNLIALGWTDLNPRGAPINYQTIGAAPNRVLIVEYDDVPFFGGGTVLSGQIKVFEGSNRIEIHTENNGNTGRTQTQGIVNQGGSIGFPVPGRNATTWSATNDAWSFTPSSVYAVDNCEVDVLNVSQRDFTCADLGPNFITISATDSSGNSATCSFFVTVVDNQNPEPVNPTLPDVVAECRVDSLTPPQVTDNCSDPVIITNNASLPITGVGTTVVTWVYNDGNGNFNFQNQNVIIQDTTPPVPDVANLPDVNAQCSVDNLPPPTATEASCSNGNISITGATNVSLPITTAGTTVITWTYDDGNGNTITQDQNIIISDTTAPVPDVANLPDINDQCVVSSLTPPTATDNCASNVIITSNANLPITSSTQITWTFDDGNGNTTTQIQNVVINDDTAPAPDVNILPDVVATCEVTSLTAPTATDNCGGAITGTTGANLPINFQGETVITWLYVDSSGNISTQDQSIIIDDTTAPVLDSVSLPDVNSECGVANVNAPTATDDCSGIITGSTTQSFPLFTQGTTVITWTFDDGNGNIVTQNQNIIINDAAAPVPDVASLPAVNSQCAVTSLNAPTATDNCTVGLVGTTSTSLPITSDTVITWTYDDGNGNISTQNQSILVGDTTAPVADVASLPAINSECAVTTLTAPTATDNCVGTLTATTTASLPITSTTTITWEYDDGNGNSTSQTQDVNINDTTAPVPNLTSLPDVNEVCEVTSLVAPTALDNCEGVIIATSNATFPIGLGTTQVIWTYTDGTGNSVTQTQNIIVTDTDAPVADCPQDLRIDLPSGTATYMLQDYTGGLNATDGCTSNTAGLTIVQSPAAGTMVAVPSTTPITITISDGNGNDLVCSFEVQTDFTASIEEPVVKVDLDIYPNPTSGKLTISSTNSNIETLTLIDFRGRRVNTWGNISAGTKTIDLSPYESAIYFISIKTDLGIVNKRVIKN